jgi:hypothetical protein
MDSWIYPALERLAAMGLITNQEVGIRPWTRAEAWRQVLNAEDEVDYLEDKAISASALPLLKDLRQELSGESTDSAGAQFETIYARVGQIAGDPLTDGFHYRSRRLFDYGILGPRQL